jgi:hypothetical protein
MTAMRKFFFGLGVLAAVLIVAGGVGFFFLSRNGAALDRMSKAYVDDSIVAITTNWDVDELWKRASPHLRRTSNESQVRGMFDAAKDALGPLVEFRGSRGEAIISIKDASVSADYLAVGHYRNGDASVRIALVKRGDTWMIEGFRINSNTLMRRLVGMRS